MRQVLELLLLWPQGKEGVGKGWGHKGGVWWLGIEGAEERTKEKVRAVECLR